MMYREVESLKGKGREGEELWGDGVMEEMKQGAKERDREREGGLCVCAVSYTHLTLPTIRRV